MLYVTTDDESGLVLYCKNCSFKKIVDNKKSVMLTDVNYTGTDEEVVKKKQDVDDSNCIMSINYSDDARSYKQFLTPNIKYDMTLPRVTNIPCPKKCNNNKKNGEVIYIKYDQVNMKYLYFCCNCEHFWKLD